MPHWRTPDTSAGTRAREQFVADFGAEAGDVTEAPSTVPVVGEYVDHYGGAVILGLGAHRVGVAVAPGEDAEVVVKLHRADGTEESGSVTLAEVGRLAAAAERPNTDSLALRLGGIAHTMIHRQLLPRDTAGLRITVVSDVPAGPALGEAEAIDAAFALGLHAGTGTLDDAPLRARLAEVCAHSAETFSPRPLTRARFTAALRGTAGSLAVIDYSDGSVMAVPQPDVPAFALLVPAAQPQDDGEARRRTFFTEACRAFGTDSLRTLPDARVRVLDWLRAVHKVHPDVDAPALAEAAEWLEYVEQETDRALAVALALRSRRLDAVWTQLASSQRETAGLTGADDALVRLATTRRALAARAAGAAGAAGVIAYAPAPRAANFSSDMAEDGLLVVELGRGDVAGIS